MLKITSAITAMRLCHSLRMVTMEWKPEDGKTEGSDSWSFAPGNLTYTICMEKLGQVIRLRKYERRHRLLRLIPEKRDIVGTMGTDDGKL